MKISLKIFLLLISFAGFSQQKTTEQVLISRSKLMAMDSTDIVMPQLATTCKQMSFDIISKVKGKIVISVGNDETLNSKVIKQLKRSDPGSKTYVDIKMNCTSAPKKKFYCITLN